MVINRLKSMIESMNIYLLPSSLHCACIDSVEIPSGTADVCLFDFSARPTLYRAVAAMGRRPGQLSHSVDAGLSAICAEQRISGRCE